MARISVIWKIKTVKINVTSIANRAPAVPMATTLRAPHHTNHHKHDRTKWNLRITQCHNHNSAISAMRHLLPNKCNITLRFDLVRPYQKHKRAVWPEGKITDSLQWRHHMTDVQSFLDSGIKMSQSRYQQFPFWERFGKSLIETTPVVVASCNISISN